MLFETIANVTSLKLKKVPNMFMSCLDVTFLKDTHSIRI